jgi:Uma2 family endonuclease
MPTIVLDGSWMEGVVKKLLAEGNRTHDEVWEGVTYLMPQPDNDHERIAAFFIRVFSLLFGMDTASSVQGTANLSDRVENWKENYRNPSMAYFAADTDAEDHDSFWYGGPDFLLEIVSPNDMSREKLPFYAGIGTKEVLILDRDPWQLELYQLRRGKLRLAGAAKPSDGHALASGVVPLSFSLVRGKPRPKIRITHTPDGQEWTF